MASDSISEHLFFKNFLGRACPQTPLALACYTAQWNVFIGALGIHMLCFWEDNTLPPQESIIPHLTPLDQNPERNSDNSQKIFKEYLSGF